MYDLDLVNIGRNIKVERVRKGYSQEELAELADTSRHSISLIESGLQHPKLISILKIANALCIDINELLK
ncbi:TPA: helix-turn-helix transcriptional regulator [Candidatus Scatousia excrementigallinarum]|uniref:Helix-turn-helix transcriptional regulator n=1 Tax=Candidatus Scatousia excrementigallinarum TaxID=2840935 RepID=A0A9D1JLR9_9BACT|nr:helix-turn-helix transcriptional regulator [Candidatus Scatousia excrementigallinarum]